MFGAIAGDIAGSIYEADPVKTKIFPLFSDTCTFTDDTVLTVAVAEVLLSGGDYVETFRRYYRHYPDRGYGYGFSRWALAYEQDGYGSFGNGSAMRVSPVGWAFDTLEEVLLEAGESAAVSHNHEEGIKGAQAVSSAVFLARTGKTKPEIKDYLQRTFNYDLERRLDDIRPGYRFDVTCQGSVPEAIIAFLEADDPEDAIRNAISLGGDSDTMACIAGAIAEAYYKGIPDQMKTTIINCLPQELMTIVAAFREKYVTEQ
jgi:ADP-ribosylglycohydrolase